jgi:hypothetical protein
MQLRRAGAVGVGAALLALLAERMLTSSGALVGTLALALAGVVWHLLDQREAPSCALGPRLRPLQVSCLALIGVGVQVFHAVEEASPLLQAGPWLATPLLAPACMLGGVVGLGILSMWSDCRDQLLSGEGPANGAASQ